MIYNTKTGKGLFNREIGKYHPYHIHYVCTFGAETLSPLRKKIGEEEFLAVMWKAKFK